MISLKTKDWVIENIDTILFDKDGTFIDLHYFWGKMTELRVQEVIKLFHISQEYFHELCLCLGYNINTGKMLKDGITALYSRPKIIKIFKNDLKKYGVETDDDTLAEIFDNVSQIFYNDMRKYTKPIKSAIEFIKQVRNKGIKCGIVTSDSIESTLLTLKYFGWETLFDVSIGRESTKENKESGVPARLALEKMDSAPKTTIMIGDAPMDYFAANNAGIEKTILVATGQIEKESLSKTSDYVVETLNDIIIL